MEQPLRREQLTEAEDKLFGNLGRYLDQHENPPTIRELATWSGISPTEAFRVLGRLKSKRYVTRGPARTMRIIP